MLALVLLCALGAACPKDDDAAAADAGPVMRDDADIAVADAAGTGGCRVDGDCRLFDDYCTGCDCRALVKGDPDPVCPRSPMACLVAPCTGKAAACRAGKCVAVVAGGAGKRWYFTCGDPVCRGSTPRTDVSACTTEQEGAACTTDGASCDPHDSCNRLLTCAASDPTISGGCPRARL